MNLTKRLTAWFLTLVMIFGLIPQTVFAQETDASLLQYEVTQEISDDKTEAIISIKFTETETIQLEKVTLPDGTEKEEDLSIVTYTASKNGNYDFKVNYMMDGTSQEETIPVEVSGLEEKKKEIQIEKNLTSAENDSNLLKNSENTYEVSTADELKNALEQIKNSKETAATIILGSDIESNMEFVGVADKSITMKSKEGQKFKITLGSNLEGDISIDNVSISAGTLYCNGHKTIFTENSEFKIGSLFGGAFEKDVDSVYVKINGKGTINSGNSELVIVGGCYKGSVNGNVYMEVDGDIKINSTQSGHYITGGNKETRYGGDTYTGEPLYVKGDINFILGLDNSSVGHNVSGTHNTHVYGDLNLTIKNGKYIGIFGQREEPKKAIVDGNINMIVGDPTRTEPVYVTYNWGIVGAGEKIASSQDLYKVGKNVNITTYGNVWCWEPDEKPGNNIGGLTGAESATVGGDVNITVNGSHMKHIIGVDTSMYYNDPTIHGNLNIIANDAHLESPYTECFIYPTTDETFIKGNVDITMNGGRTNQIGAHNGVIDGNVTINLKGKPIITHDVIGKSIEDTSSSDESVLNVNQGTVSIPQGIWYFKTVNINDKSSVSLGNTEKNAFQGKIYDVNVIDSSLTTNKQAYSKGSLTVKNGSFTAKGYTYISEMTNTKNSTIRFNDYVDLGYGYSKDTIWNKEVLNSENDVYIFGPNNSLNKIHGNASFSNGECKIYGWLKIFGNYTGKNNALDIFAFTGNNNYPDSTIKLEILGKSTGTTRVTLVDYNDADQEGIPVVGQNYINALTESDNTFILDNQNAKEKGLYFKKLSDADIKNKVGYDMWQVAKKDAYRVLYSFESGTSEKNLPDEITDLLPTDSTKYYEGDTITAKNPTQLEFEVSDGVWKFEGYDADSKIANANNVNEDGNIQFTGTWIFETKKYDVSYKFESINTDKEIPKEISDTLPTVGSVEHGKTVNAPSTKFNDVVVTDGVWTFKGWTPTKYENVKGDVEFIGKWEFKKNASIINLVPTISASDKTLTVGDEFDPLKDVTATDKEDGDIILTIKNVIKNKVDTTKPGVYEVTYKVTDSKGASTTKTIYVTVNPKMEGLNQIPVINAEDKAIYVGDSFDPLKDVTATDKEDGDITKEIEILNNEVDINKAGVYEVTYKVTDSQGASTVKTIKVTVKAKETPVVPSEPDKPNTPNDSNKPIIPDTSVNDKNPQTGDHTNMTLWSLLFVASSIGLVCVYRKKKRINKLIKR